MLRFFARLTALSLLDIDGAGGGCDGPSGEIGKAFQIVLPTGEKLRRGHEIGIGEIYDLAAFVIVGRGCAFNVDLAAADKDEACRGRCLDIFEARCGRASASCEYLR